MRVFPKANSPIDPPIIEVEPEVPQPEPPKVGSVYYKEHGIYTPKNRQYARSIPATQGLIRFTYSGGTPIRFKERVVVYPYLDIWLHLESGAYMAYKIESKVYGSVVYD